MTKTICITGGIGSGKSTLVRYLKKKKFDIHDSDEIVKKIYQKPSKIFQDHLIKMGLKKAINKKKINKKIIANEIFSNILQKQTLENFIHKEVQKDRNKFVNYHKKKKTKIVFFDIPLLFENNLDSLFDKILCILCPKNIRLKRVIHNRSTPLDIFKKIIKNQVTNVERKKRSDYCIVNNKTKKHFFKKVDNFLKTTTI